MDEVEAGEKDEKKKAMLQAQDMALRAKLALVAAGKAQLSVGDMHALEGRVDGELRSQASHPSPDGQGVDTGALEEFMEKHENMRKMFEGSNIAMEGITSGQGSGHVVLRMGSDETDPETGVHKTGVYDPMARYGGQVTFNQNEVRDYNDCHKLFFDGHLDWLKEEEDRARKAQ
jgi:hypothetical protein